MVRVALPDCDGLDVAVRLAVALWGSGCCAVLFSLDVLGCALDRLRRVRRHDIHANRAWDPAGGPRLKLDCEAQANVESPEC